MSELNEAIDLLSSLIAAPSISREENMTASLLEEWMTSKGMQPKRYRNNLWAVSSTYDASKPTLLLNSHHDTVRPSSAYTINPFSPELRGNRLYGLGSNDAGASLVDLTLTFYKHRAINHNFNIILALTAEEEVGGENGIRSLIPVIKEDGYDISMALVGEPTGLQAAVGERGLIVLDCIAHGKTGHAARQEGINAIYIAIDDIRTLTEFRFPRISPLLGDIKISVTQIQAGTQHNVIPHECRFVVDVRTTDAYSNEETARILTSLIKSDAKPRSTRVWASAIPSDHPLVITAETLGCKTFVSPTTSDMSLLHHIPSLKIGPGQSARSHTADEYIEIAEIDEGIKFYNNFLNELDRHIL